MAKLHQIFVYVACDSGSNGQTSFNDIAICYVLPLTGFVDDIMFLYVGLNGVMHITRWKPDVNNMIDASIDVVNIGLVTSRSIP